MKPGLWTYSRLKNLVSTDYNREALSYVCYDPRTERIIATDGRVLAILPVESEDADPQYPILIPVEAFDPDKIGIKKASGFGIQSQMWRLRLSEKAIHLEACEEGFEKYPVMSFPRVSADIEAKYPALKEIYGYFDGYDLREEERTNAVPMGLDLSLLQSITRAIPPVNGSKQVSFYFKKGKSKEAFNPRPVAILPIDTRLEGVKFLLTPFLLDEYFLKRKVRFVNQWDSARKGG